MKQLLPLLTFALIGSGCVPSVDFGMVTSSDDLTFYVDGMVLETASNPGAKVDDDGNVLLLFEERGDDISGKNGIAMASEDSDWLSFTVVDESADIGAFRALELPDGTYRAYGVDPTKGVAEGYGCFTSRSSQDGVTFTEDEGCRYVLQDFDHESIGVYELFVNSDDDVILIYLGNLRGPVDAQWGKNTARRAVSTDGGWTFEFDRGYILGDEDDDEADAYVDQKVISLGNERWRLISMSGGQIYSFISEDDGYSFVLEGQILTTNDFAQYDIGSLHDPVIVQLPDGRFRIYVTGKVGGSDEQHLFSATTRLD